MKFLNKNAILSLSLASLVGSFGVACEQPKTGGNSVPTNSNSALNSTAGSMNSNSSADSNMNLSGSNNSMIDTKEPEKYQATVLLKLETAGALQISAVELSTACRLCRDKQPSRRLAI